MKCIHSVSEMQSEHEKSGPRILVPTMGALHQGHLSLMRIAREQVGEEGTVIVSIFVNPTQFDREEDLLNYPQTLEDDIKACASVGVDIVFAPSSQEMYATDHSLSLSENALSGTLCGATRPGHFEGVCLVCTKLFLITRASHAVFGEKDFQQLSIIQRLVRDLHLPVEIIPGETMREPSGLAMSSRNLNLSDTHKKYAPAIFQGLNMAKQELAYGTDESQKLIALVSHHLSQLPVENKIDYLDIVDAETLAPIESTSGHQAVMAIAVFFGDVRLIDNIRLH